MLHHAMSILVLTTALLIGGCDMGGTKTDTGNAGATLAKPTPTPGKCEGCLAMKECPACKAGVKDGKCTKCGMTAACEKCTAHTDALVKCEACLAIKECTACKMVLKDGKCPGCGKSPVCKMCDTKAVN